MADPKVDDMLMDIDDLQGEDVDVSMTDRDTDDANTTELEPYTYKDHTLDCYPYTFSPLLLFSTDGYFDRGYSNYNAVASFFDPVLRGVLGDDWEDNGGGGEEVTDSPRRSSRSPSKSPQKGQGSGGGGIDMLEGVVYERKNMA